MVVESPPLEQAQAVKKPAKPIIRIAALCGSLRPGSYTRAALKVALSGASELGAQTELIDLRDFELTFATGGDDTGGASADVQRLSRLLKTADGVILGTPEYHGSVSGVLKNALDLMGFEEFEGKMIGLVGVSGGRLGAVDALNTLRNVGRALHAWVIPEQAGVPEAWRVFTPTGEITDVQLQERLRDVGRQVARFALLHKCAEAHDFLKNWETAQVNPGGE